MITTIGKIWTIMGLKEKAWLVLGVLGFLLVVIFATRWITTREVEAEKDAEWELKIATAPAETTVVERLVILPGRQVLLPGETVVMTVEDSAKVRNLIARSDSLEGLIYDLTKTRMAIDDDTVATVRVWYYPFMGSFEIRREYKPQRIYDRFIEKMVLKDAPRPWLRLKGGAGWRPEDITAFAEAELRVIDGFWVGPRVETEVKGEKPKWGVQGSYTVEW